MSNDHPIEHERKKKKEKKKYCPLRSLNFDSPFGSNIFDSIYALTSEVGISILFYSYKQKISD